MPQHKSAWKRVRTSAKRRDRNRTVRAEVHTAIRHFEEAAKDEKAALLRKATSVLDNAVRKGVVKDRTASRRKSRLAKRLNRLNAEPASKA
jgi:small subunit ribosomal protein S20